MTTKDGRRAPGTLEAGVMGILWAAGAPLSAAAVHREIGGELAYNTVQTILIRLHEKKVVERRRDGRGHLYWPVQDAATAAAFQMRAALADRPDRHAVLQQFAASLDESDAKTLRQLLSATDVVPLVDTGSGSLADTGSLEDTGSLYDTGSLGDAESLADTGQDRPT